jgi:hypothetical protein
MLQPTTDTLYDNRYLCRAIESVTLGFRAGDRMLESVPLDMDNIDLVGYDEDGLVRLSTGAFSPALLSRIIRAQPVQVTVRVHSRDVQNDGSPCMLDHVFTACVLAPSTIPGLEVHLQAQKVTQSLTGHVPDDAPAEGWTSYTVIYDEDDDDY